MYNGQKSRSSGKVLARPPHCCPTGRFFRYSPTIIRQWMIDIASRRTYLPSTSGYCSKVQQSEALRVRGSTWVAWPPHDLEDDALKNGEVDAGSKSDLNIDVSCTCLGYTLHLKRVCP